MSLNATPSAVLKVPNIFLPPTLSTFFITFNLIVCAELIGYFGIVGNIVNILNFKKQGLQDSVNVTLIALAVSDLGALICQSFLNILTSPIWSGVELPFSSMTAFSMSFFYPHGFFIRASGFITAFAAFERCLCVVLPLKVKRIITKKIAIATNMFIFMLMSLYLFPIYYVSYLQWLKAPGTNRTVLTIVYRSNAESVLSISYIINDLFVPYTTFAVLIVCTIVIILKLRSKAKWRKRVTGDSSKALADKSQMSGKEKKTVVMLAVVSTIYVLCLTPQCVMMTCIGIFRELKVGGSYFELTNFIYSFTSLLETINCSVTIIVYYNMSTRYKEHVQTWFTFLHKSNKY